MWSVARQREIKALFGRPLRIALLLWIDGHGQPFFQSEAQDAMRRELGSAPSNVPGELDRLVAAGLVTRSEVPPRVYFTARPSPYWRAFKAIGRALEEAQPPPTEAEDGHARA